MVARTVVSGRWSVVSGAPASGPGGRLRRRRPGITLTEILISIMILGVGLVSLATLFPIGLLRLRDATRYTRSATLLETAASDAISRGLFSSSSFTYADLLNYQYGYPGWYTTVDGQQYNPLTQDTPYYYGDWFTVVNNQTIYLGARSGAPAGNGPGLPFAYDPLWRFQTPSTVNGVPGYYMGDTYEARFAYGLTTVRTDPYDGGLPSAHGLQRITNFNRTTATVNGSVVAMMPGELFVPNIFVSQEDVVWQAADASGTTYTVGGVGGGTPVTTPSPVLPDLNTASGSVSLDWRYSWMFTGQLSNAGNLSTFDGNIVIFENRPFGIQTPANPPFTPGGNYQSYQVDGEIVVEGVFGYSGNVIDVNGNPNSGPGYGAGADRSVLLRWPATMPDPVVRPGDWIADVTYERQQQVIYNVNNGSGRFLNGSPPAGYPNWTNKLEWDNMPAQRCFWYQVQKVTQPVADNYVANHRSMVVYVNQNLQARTVLNANGTPYFLNAALIAPNVINVIPQTIFVR